MGGENFYNVAYGSTPEEAFRDAHRRLASNMATEVIPEQSQRKPNL